MTEYSNFKIVQSFDDSSLGRWEPLNAIYKICNFDCYVFQVIEAADDVIRLVDTDALARHFSMKCDAEDPNAAVSFP